MQRKRARIRADILIAARQLFAAKGYHDTSIADITAATDISVGAFYLYFRDKDDAYQSIVATGLQTIRQTLIETIGPQHDVTLAHLVRELLRIAYRERDLFQIMQMGTPIRPMRLQRVLADIIVETLVAAEAFPPSELKNHQIIARFLTGSLFQAIGWWAEADDPDPDVMADLLINFLYDGLPPAFRKAHPWLPDLSNTLLPE